MSYVAERGALLMGAGIVVAGVAADEKSPGWGAGAVALIAGGGLLAYLNLGERSPAMKLRWLAVYAAFFCVAAPIIFAVESDAALWIVALAIAFVAPFIAGLISPGADGINDEEEDGEKDWGRLA